MCDGESVRESVGFSRVFLWTLSFGLSVCVCGPGLCFELKPKFPQQAEASPPGSGR